VSVSCSYELNTFGFDFFLPITCLKGYKKNFDDPLLFSAYGTL